jgi:hypothetical protein
MAAFPAIRIEGGLLGPETLDQLLAAELTGQRPADFELEARRNLTDEIAAAFADARALWGVFQRRLERLSDDDPATTDTRDFWAVPLFRLLGYAPQYNPRAQEIDGQSFWVFYRADEAEDAPPLHIVGARQELGRVPASGRPRLAPHSLVQEYLNRTEHVWGVVTNGLVLRLLRNSTFVRRQAYVEFDLRSILAEQRFNDFQALYRLLHRTRLPRSTGAGCLLDKYYAQSEEQGDRVRKNLRYGVEECIKRLANGFLHHQANQSLRRGLCPEGAAEGRPDAQELYRQLLRLIYRFLFLLVSEDRGLLSADPVYVAHYGIARLRRLLDHRAAYTADDDLWHSLRVLWRVLADDKLAGLLGLPPLNGELFAPIDLDHCTIGNRELLEAFWHLAWYQEGTAPPRRVNHAALDVEELGSVYESLLDFHPIIVADGVRRSVFDLIEGSERKRTGSYYTRRELVAQIVKSALDPLIVDRLAAAPGGEREKALLSMRVCDPACGSGHFLLAAARRLGQEIARLRTGEDEPAPERVREATRDAIAHCIYGVDKNALAVDLCRVALWLESHTGDKPLTFLDHRIRCGDALIGVFDLAVLKDAIPDNAFNPLETDDKETAAALKLRNRSERSGQRELLDWQPAKAVTTFADLSRAIDAIADDTPEAVQEKTRLFKAGHSDSVWEHYREACDLWTGAFFQRFIPGAPAITSAALLDHMDGRAVPVRITDFALELADRYSFFHWPIEFAEAWSAGGFDLITGNPPWDTMSPDAKEWFSTYAPEIADLAPDSQAARIAEICKDQDIKASWEAHSEALYRAANFIRYSGRYRLFAPGNLGKGDFNVWRIFTELALHGVRRSGTAAQLVPENFYSGANAAAIRGEIFTTFDLRSMIGFENRRRIWFDIDSSLKFATYAAVKGAQTQEIPVVFGVNTLEKLTELQRGLPIRLPIELVREFSPEALAIAEVAHPADIAIVRKLYARLPKFGEDLPDAPRRRYYREVDMGNNREDFGNDPDGVPLYEGSMVSHFDHRAKAYRSGHGRTAQWDELPFGVTGKRIASQWRLLRSDIPAKNGDNWCRTRIGFCDVGKPINQRTLMAALIPPGVVCGHTISTLDFSPEDHRLSLLWLGVANSLAIDYAARKKVSRHLSLSVMDSLPLPRRFSESPLECAIASRALRLSATGSEMAPFWRATAPLLGMDPIAEAPTEDSAERERLRTELDVLVGRDFFGLSTDEMRYLLDPADILGPDCGFETFGALQRAERRAFGNFRTRCLILEAWSQLPSPFSAFSPRLALSAQ